MLWTYLSFTRAGSLYYAEKERCCWNVISGINCVVFYLLYFHWSDPLKIKMSCMRLSVKWVWHPCIILIMNFYGVYSCSLCLLREMSKLKGRGESPFNFHCGSKVHLRPQTEEQALQRVFCKISVSHVWDSLNSERGTVRPVCNKSCHH